MTSSLHCGLTRSVYTLQDWRDRGRHSTAEAEDPESRHGVGWHFWRHDDQVLNDDTYITNSVYEYTYNTDTVYTITHP